MSSIFQGQFGKHTTADQKNAYDELTQKAQRNKDNNYRGLNVSKILEDKVPLKSGGFLTIHPARIADDVKQMMDDMRRNPLYSFIKPYIEKPVIWTYEAKTAFTDGIRIYMSPVFAHVMLSKKYGAKEAEEYWAGLSGMEQRDSKCRQKYNSIYTRYLRFVLIHEVYHILYNHVRRGALKYGGKPTEVEHELGNIAMDLEINRDIESTFEELRGATETISGVWYKNEKYYKSDGTIFKKDIWEDVWDDWMESGKQFKTEDPLNREDVNPVQKSSKQNSPYADGWRKAIDAIKGKQLDPTSINLGDVNDKDLSSEEVMDIINKMANIMPEGKDEN